jgi:hypothetical protein
MEFQVKTGVSRFSGTQVKLKGMLENLKAGVPVWAVFPKTEVVGK